MLYSGTDPESHITEYTLVYKDKSGFSRKTSRLTMEVNPTPSVCSFMHMIDRQGWWAVK
jgi:hypothetical protein